MFGAPTTPFGSPAVAPAASPFGAPAAPAAGGFGAAAAPPAFGSPAPAPAGGFGGFGGAAAAPAPAAGGFGGFGAAPAPAAPAAGGFGGFGSPAAGAGAATSAFGSPAPVATPFGAPAPAPGGFGAPAAGGFGAAPAPAPGGLFGGAAVPAAGGFGAATPGAAGGFGAAATPGAAGGFGAAPSTGFGAAGAATPGAFGAPAPAPGGGLFGGAPTPTTGFGAAGAAPATGAFGATSPAAGGGLFGATPAPAAGGGLFGAAGGAAAGATGKPGTMAFPYNVTIKQDGTGTAQISIQAITAMPQYEAQSLEELRLADYMAGNKGSMGQQVPGAAPAAGGFGGFGAAAPAAPGGFGASPPAAPGAFGAPAPAPGGLFGGAAAPAPGAFGAAPAPGGFGAAPAPAPGGFGGFGAAPPAAPAPAAGGFGGFGAAPAPKPAGLFGATPAPAPGGLFGAAPAPAPGGGLFGGAPAAAPAAGGLFGAPAAAPAAGGLFGAAPAPAAPAAGGLFGAPAPVPAAGGLFGAPAAPAPAAGGLFGSPAAAPAGGGLFGAPAAAAPPPGGLFGAPAPAPAAGGLFGAPAPVPAAGGLFGAPAPAPVGGGLFGAPAPAPGGLFGAPAAAPAGGGLFGAPAPAPGGLFGAPAPAPGGLYGAPAPGVGAPGGVMAPYAVPAGVMPPTPDAVLAQQLAALDRKNRELEQLESWRGSAPSGSGVIPASLSERDAASRSAAYGYGSGSKAAGSAASSALTVYQPSTTPRSGARIRPRGFGPVRSTPLVAGADLIGNGGTGGSPLLSPGTYLGSSAKRLVIKEGSLAPKPKMRLQLTNGDSAALRAQQPVENGAAPVEPAEADEGVIHRAALDAVGPASPAAVAALQLGVASPRNPPAFASPQQQAAAPAASPSPAVCASPAPAEGTPAMTVERTPRPSSAKKTGTPRSAGYDFYQRVVGASEENDEQDHPAASPQMNGGSHSRAPKLTKAGYECNPSLATLSSKSPDELAAVSGFSVSRPGIGSVAWDGAVDVRDVDLDAAVTIEAKDVAVYDAEELKGTKPPVGSKLNRPAVIAMHGVYPKEGSEASDAARTKFHRKIEKTTKKMGAELIAYDPAAGVWKFRVQHFSRYGLFDDEDTDDDDVEDVAPMATDGHVAPRGMDDSGMDMEQDFQSGDRGGRSPLVGGNEEEDAVFGQAAMAASKTSRGARSRIRAPSEDDMSEKTEDESTALTSEDDATGADSEAQMLQAADKAYAMMLDPGRAAGGGTEAEPDSNDIMRDDVEEEEVTMFGEEGESSGGYVNEEPKPLVGLGSVKRSNFSARLARKCGIEVSTSSSTDFGLRMGRSFRVAWRPDGSFLVPGQPRLSSNANGFPSVSVPLVQRRPVFNESADRLNLDEDATDALLETHLQHSVESSSQDTTASDCPSFELPRSDRKGGDGASYKALRDALDDLSEAAAVGQVEEGDDPEAECVVSRAFSLLSTLIGQEDEDFAAHDRSSTSFPDVDLADPRRREALLDWLRDAVAHDAQGDIQRALQRGDAPAALLAAVSGCDAAEVSDLAAERGYARLAALVSSCGGDESRSLVREQIDALHASGATGSAPPNLLRAYSLLGGDEGLEGSLYQSGGPAAPTNLDWRRRFALKLQCGGDDVDATLSSLCRTYDADCARGIAPLPVPRYAVDEHGSPAEKNMRCLLYRLLSLGNSYGPDGTIKMSSVVSPLSHTHSPHDYSYAFHLASALASMDSATELTCQETANLVDGYVMQLLRAGRWQWAAYACLCAGGGSRGSLRVLWRAKAEDIVGRYCTAASVDHRSFLETDVGVPSSWFDNALATRCAYNSDHIGQARYTSQIAPEISMEMFEEMMVPEVLFRGKALVLMQQMEDGQFLNEEGVLYRFLSVCKEVLDLSQLSRSARVQRSERMRELIADLREMKTRLEGDDDLFNYDGESIRRRLDERRSIPRSVCDAELLSCLCLLEMQLQALSRGASIFDLRGPLEGRRLKVASQLAFLSCPPEGDADYSYSVHALGASDILRGDYAVE